MKLTAQVYLLASGSLGTGMSHASDCNVYGIECGSEFVIVDSGVGQNSGDILKRLAEDGVDAKRVGTLLLTHGHLDHSGGAWFLRERLKARVAASSATAVALESGNQAAISLTQAKGAGVYAADFPFQACPVDQRLADGQRLSFSAAEIEVLTTPGHSHDMLSFLFRSEKLCALFSGDTLFYGGRILLSTVYDCSVQDYEKSLRKIARYQFEGLFPGHGLWVSQGASAHVRAASKALDRLLLPPNLI
ncbi:MAG: MBL fold metallo-hydrolase [Acidobacteriota bacterium]